MGYPAAKWQSRAGPFWSDSGLELWLHVPGDMPRHVGATRVSLRRIGSYRFCLLGVWESGCLGMSSRKKTMESWEGNSIIKTRHHLAPRVLHVLQFQQSCIQMFFGTYWVLGTADEGYRHFVGKELTA